MQNTKLLHLSRYLPFQEGLQMATNDTKESFSFTDYLSKPAAKLVLHSFDYLLKDYQGKPFEETLVYQFIEALIDWYDMQRCELVSHNCNDNYFSIMYKNVSTGNLITITFSEKGISVLGEFTEVFHYQAALEFLYSKHIAFGMGESEYHDKDKTIIQPTNLTTV